MAIASLPEPVSAQSSNHAKGPAVGVGVGTLGLAAEASYKATSNLVWRFNAGGFDLGKDVSEGGNSYNAKARLLGAGAIATTI